ncbi:protein of unknown function [Bradyrhizobium sp. ORS 285]|uniref:hypothetical protein n=1 Tax=Bradyrhizobium sp. ORS 285 TaxID=115808 RepID=UPI0002409596|nr:hypothetical protein [Bradyrhizobium sp. ORS 285]CCD89850.1 hypothetical protein BRAO285_850055 [Bradyrhizobium sp. ORS 285]SMX61522.1 protein of unknown function [Bradyrhizobium sp. ORS 285]
MDPLIQKYIELIKANTSAFKTFYVGDPIAIPASNMPALIITRQSTAAQPATNAEDLHKLTLQFCVVADVRSTITDDKTLVPGYQLLYDLMEGRDPSTLQLKSGSLLNILRHNIDIDQAHQIWTDIDTPTRIQYATYQNKRGSPSWSIEGTLSAVASIVQLR